MTCLTAPDSGLTGECIKLGDHSQRLLCITALLLWLLGAPAHFPFELQTLVGLSSLEHLPLAFKPPNQAAVLGVDADPALRQVKHEGLEVTVPVSFLKFHSDDPPQ